FEQVLALMGQYKASDLHLKAGCPVIMRISGLMRPLAGQPLTSDDIRRLLGDVASPEQLKIFDETGDIDFAHQLPDRSRFRLNAFHDKRANAVVVRRISTNIPKFRDLNLPQDTMEKLSSYDDGMVILAGVTGSGKSTTIAAMIDHLNETDARHIITIEDPIEYEFQNKRSFISQREIGVDCLNFKAAIRTLVRQDPDVVLIGEMRDHETFEFGLTAAETGHLVFGTLHAGTVPQSIGRILGLFPTDKHTILRQGLEFNLRSIICQKLLPSINPQFSRVPVLEIMVVNPIIKKLIREGEDVKISQVMSGARSEGMMTFNQCLNERVKQNLISEQVALEVSANPEQLKMMIQGIELGSAKGLSM
ncbi:MAG: type IV pilus twitching motility protein PilT, partial [Planctomycetota bacterium]